MGVTIASKENMKAILFALITKTILAFLLEQEMDAWWRREKNSSKR
jgi:hypothetical protein